MYVELLLALPIHKTFYYRTAVQLKLYSYVKVPFCNTICIGLVLNNYTTCSIEKIKDVHEVLNIPCASTQFVSFLKWVASYNIMPAGSLLKLAISGVSRSERYYSLSNSLFSKSMIATHRKVVELFKEKKVVSEFELCSYRGVSGKTLESMVGKEIIQLSDRPVLKSSQVTCNISLSKQQSVALKSIYSALGKKVVLLDGVTGSGKTELYLKVVADVLNSSCGGQALILLPEIILTSQIEGRFNKYFKSLSVVNWHSSLSKKTRDNHWWKIVNGEAQIIIGARSALFLPYKNLKIVVVDEEHDNSFKQWAGKNNYNARDMAIVKAKLENISILLSSATPSLESFYNAYIGKFEYVKLDSRYKEVALPSIEVVDMKQERGFLSSKLCSAIDRNLQSKKQTLLFLNRRGYSRFTTCRDCGYKVSCINCSTWLVEHKSYRSLLCHYCGYSTPMVNVCPSCNSVCSLEPNGLGVEKLAEEVVVKFSRAKVLTLSSDLIAKNAQEVLSEVISGDVDIIVGTQLIAKGHHFPKLSLVAIIDGDATLYGGDLRSAERTYQLLQQVAGRAGREKDTCGVVLLQSYYAKKITQKYLCEKKDFYLQELSVRKSFNMPPFSRISNIVLSSDKKGFVCGVASNIVSELRDSRLRVIGPLPANIVLQKKKFIYKVIIISPKSFDIQSHICSSHFISKYQSMITIDVDSFDLL